MGESPEIQSLSEVRSSYLWQKEEVHVCLGSSIMVYNLGGLPATTSLTNQILEMAPQEPPVTTAKKGKGAKLNKYSQLLL